MKVKVTLFDMLLGVEDKTHIGRRSPHLVGSEHSRGKCPKSFLKHISLEKDWMGCIGFSLKFEMSGTVDWERNATCSVAQGGAKPGLRPTKTMVTCHHILRGSRQV